MTCETCHYFVPVKDHRLFEGACHNKVATLGAVIQTSRQSRCNYHVARSSEDSADTRLTEQR